MRKLLILLLLLTAAFCYPQSNATFNNLDVRGTSKLRGLIYPFGAAAKSPLSESDDILMFQTSDSKLVKVDFAEFVDSLNAIIDTSLWVRTGDTIYNKDSTIVKLNNWLMTDFITSSATNKENVILGYEAFKKDVRLGDSAAYNLIIGTQAGWDSDTITNSLILGYYAGSMCQNVYESVLIGTASSQVDTNIQGVLAIGPGSAYNISNVSLGNFIGYNCGHDIDHVDSSIFIGNETGAYSTNFTKSILIGDSVGYMQNGISDQLWIDNTSTSSPLIHGFFADDSLRLNANVAFVKDLWYEDTYWRDATVSATALAPGANAPALRTIIGGIQGYGYAPSVQNDISYGQVQLNHDYKFDTDLHAHMHFMIEEAGEAGDTAVFALEYSWADIDETFPASDTMTVLIPCAPITAKQHKLIEFGEISGPGGNNVSSSIIFRLERLQNSVHDTYNGANEYVIVLDIDFHLEIDAPGSRDEYYK